MIGLDGPRGKRVSMPATGSSRRLGKSVWRFTSEAHCICGKSFRAKGFFPDGGSEEYRKKLIKDLRNNAQDQWWECYKSHHGEFGLEAIDGTI